MPHVAKYMFFQSYNVAYANVVAVQFVASQMALVYAWPAAGVAKRQNTLTTHSALLSVLNTLY